MTMVRMPIGRAHAPADVVGKMLLAAVFCFAKAGVFCFAEAGVVGLMLCGQAVAQPRGTHPLYHPALPPGAIGSQRLMGNGPLSGYIQPVELRAPQGVQVGAVQSGGFGPTREVPAMFGLNLARVYQFRVTNLPHRPGVEVFPTVELVDRLHPPVGQEHHFPIPIELTSEDLILAANGYLVTRVVYVEDPQQALPIASDPRRQNSIDAHPGENPFEVAKQMGRPVAIVRIGSRIPDVGRQSHHSFAVQPPVEMDPPPRIVVEQSSGTVVPKTPQITPPLDFGPVVPTH